MSRQRTPGPPLASPGSTTLAGQRLLAPRLRRCAALLLALGATGAPGHASAGDERLTTWRKEASGVEADPGASDRPMRVGSLQKPFVAKAWAAAHAGETPPRLLCDERSGCWLRGGHGELGLVQALAVSCNTYFRRLADHTPPEALTTALAGEGFRLPRGLTSDAAIGLPSPGDAVSIRPSILLEAYSRLVRTPWAIGEPIRQQVLAGLREAARSGTAAGLGQRGYWAKTGTIGAMDASPSRTAGLAVAVDDSGWAILGLLDPGTGREAAAAMAGPLRRLRPWTSATKRLSDDPSPTGRRAAAPAPGVEAARSARAAVPIIELRLFELLRPRRVLVTNLDSTPVATSNGYLGPGGRLELTAGRGVGPGLLEIEVPDLGLRRRLRAQLRCDQDPREGLRLTARLTTREYVLGVINAELTVDQGIRRADLGSAVLRFLAQGPRHSDATVCDTTHCAWFVGRGPRLKWLASRQALLETPGAARSVDLDDMLWDRIREGSRRPGPSLWTSHCGGHPLSSHAVWGNGDPRTSPCSRHRATQGRSWVREWPARALEQALGAEIGEVSIESEAGVWVLRVVGAGGSRRLRYDDAHRLLATSLGWSALPSPADRVEAVPGGFRAQGVGLGHRVGLCLAD